MNNSEGDQTLRISGGRAGYTLSYCLTCDDVLPLKHLEQLLFILPNPAPAWCATSVKFPVCLTVCHSFHTSLHCSFLLSHLYFSTVTVSRPDCKLLHTGTAYILCVSVYNVYYNRPSTEWEIKPVTFVCHTLQVKPISSKLYPTTSTFHRPLEAKKKKIY